MNKRILSDYYPVYKDFTDQIDALPEGRQFKYPLQPLGMNEELENQVSNLSEFHSLLNAEELIHLALKCRFTPFQIVILLLKSVFEGHVFLTYNLRPEQLFHEGTLLFQPQPKILIHSFYKQLSQYHEGLLKSWELLKQEFKEINDVNFESLLQNLIINHLVRFPVSLFPAVDLGRFKELTAQNKQDLHKRFEMVSIGENVQGEFEFMNRVNCIYAEKFKEFAQQLQIKEEIFNHYQQKMILALYPDVHTEEELDELMYKKLIEEKLKSQPENRELLKLHTPEHSGTSGPEQEIRNKIKMLYRLISKNCSEVHTSTENENKYPELTQIFLQANNIYNETNMAFSDAWFNYICMVVLFSKLVIFRKSNMLPITDSTQFLSDYTSRGISISNEDLKLLRRTLDDKLVNFRLKNFVDFRMKFAMEDEFTEIHKHFIQKQIDFVEDETIQLQIDIRNVLKNKSYYSIRSIRKN
jgi:hypothetical protein